MPLQLITPPAEEPVSLAEAKLHLRVDVTDDDALIAALISAARQAAETITGRQFVTARWKLVLDAFPESRTGTGNESCLLPGNAILIHKCPVQSVLSVQYLDMAGTLQTVSALDYMIDTACEPARVTPVFGKAWPPSLPQIGAVTVTFDSGYGAASSVPPGIKSWIKLRAGSLYAHREDLVVLNRGSVQSLPFVDGLLDPYRVAFL